MQPAPHQRSPPQQGNRRRTHRCGSAHQYGDAIEKLQIGRSRGGCAGATAQPKQQCSQCHSRVAGACGSVPIASSGTGTLSRILKLAAARRLRQCHSSAPAQQRSQSHSSAAAAAALQPEPQQGSQDLSAPTLAGVNIWLKTEGVISTGLRRRLRRTDPHRVNIWFKIEGFISSAFVGGYSASTLTVVNIRFEVAGLTRYGPSWTATRRSRSRQ